MAIIDLVMPKMGESIMEATILKWHKKLGDSIALDETLLDIATDKVDSEVPSSVAGKITEILFNENDVVPVGKVIAKVETAGENVSAPAPAPQQAPAFPQEEIKVTPPYVPEEEFSAESNESSSNAGTNRFYSPLVLNIAQSEGVPLSDLEKIPGTGNEGRVTKKDILAYVAQGKNVPAQKPAQAPAEKTVAQRERKKALPQ